MPATRQSIPDKHRRRSGIVLVLVLLGLFLIVALVLYVLNLGRHANARVVTQHAADAAAISGSGWAARTANTVALNNLGIAQLIVAVNALDSVPLAVDFALREEQPLQQVVAGYLQRGINGSWVRDAMTTLQSQVQTEINTLTPVDEVFNRSGYDVREMTFYDGPAGRGKLWQAMQAMDLYSQTALLNLGIHAQINTRADGLLNLSTLGDSTSAGNLALLVPVEPQLPTQRGQFDDFRQPVLAGLLPDDVDDREVNRGPYDTVFGWRHLLGGGAVGYWEGGESTGASGRGNVPIGARAGTGDGRGGRFVVTGRRPPDAYTVYGPQTWTMDRTGSFAGGQLRHSRFATFMQIQAYRKLANVWPEALNRPNGAPPPLIQPDWITDIHRARAIAQSEPNKVRETIFIAVEIKSRYPEGHNGFLSPGSWTYINRVDHTRFVRRRGWTDPATWIKPPDITQVGSFVVRDRWQYTVERDSEIGITQIIDPQNGQIVRQPVYRIDDFFFIAINIGPEVEVRNPYNFTSRADLPAPTDLDHTQLKPDDEAATRKYLTYLAVAAGTGSSPLWPTRFASGAPAHNMLGLAQTRVFNDHSFDLWTPMWHAQLETVRQYPDWIAALQVGPANTLAPGLTEADVNAVRQYLENLAGLAPVTLMH